MNTLLEKYGFTASEQTELGITVVPMEAVKKSHKPRAIKVGNLIGFIMSDDGATMDTSCNCSLNSGEVLCATVG